jgi:hypothetical protein
MSAENLSALKTEQGTPSHGYPFLSEGRDKAHRDREYSQFMPNMDETNTFKLFTTRGGEGSSRVLSMSSFSLPHATSGASGFGRAVRGSIFEGVGRFSKWFGVIGLAGTGFLEVASNALHITYSGGPLVAVAPWILFGLLTAGGYFLERAGKKSWS